MAKILRPTSKRVRQLESLSGNGYRLGGRALLSKLLNSFRKQSKSATYYVNKKQRITLFDLKCETNRPDRPIAAATSAHKRRDGADAYQQSLSLNLVQMLPDIRIQMKRIVCV